MQYGFGCCTGLIAIQREKTFQAAIWTSFHTNNGVNDLVHPDTHIGQRQAHRINHKGHISIYGFQDRVTASPAILLVFRIIDPYQGLVFFPPLRKIRKTPDHGSQGFNGLVGDFIEWDSMVKIPGQRLR